MVREVLTCQECDLNYQPNRNSTNGPVIFRCEWCNMLVQDKLALRHQQIQRQRKYWTPVGYALGILIVAYIFLWPLLDRL